MEVESMSIRRMSPVLMAGIMLASILSGLPVMPVDGAGSSFGGGSGTLADPYIIEDVRDLQNITQKLGEHFVLKNDIDASATVNWNSGAGFIPIGRGQGGFYGSLDGKNHTITGLFINRSKAYYFGLFSSIDEGGSVKNVILKDCNVSADYYTGSLVGYNMGTLSNCHASGDVSGSNIRIGGLVGYNREGTVSDSYAKVNVTGKSLFGGLVGSQAGTVSNSHYNIDDVLINGEHHVTMGGLYNAQFNDWLSSDLSLDISDYSPSLVPYGQYHDIGSVQGLKDLLGFADVAGYKFRLTADIDLSADPGFFIPTLASDFDGDNHTTSNLLLDLPNDFQGMIGLNKGGTISNITLIHGDVDGNDRIGGLVGYNDHGTVSTSHYAGIVRGDGSIGGLAGYSSGTVEDSSAAGIVAGFAVVGGLIGVNVQGTVSGSHATSDVSGDGSGGLIGFNEGGTVSSSYATGNVGGDENVGGLIAYSNGSVSDSYATGNVGGGQDVGGLIGSGRNVSDCHATGNVSGGRWVGGLVGSCFGFVNNSYATGNVRAYYAVGGLIGESWATVNNSYATGNVTGEDFEVGGLIGIDDGGTVSNSYATGNATGGSLVGGLVGYKGQGKVSSSHATGNANGTELIGGLVGYTENGTVSSSYATGNATGTSCVGGCVGYSGGTVRDSYAWGTVTNSSGASPYFGGFIGFNYRGKVQNCYSVGAVVCAGGTDPTDKGFAGGVDTGGEYDMTGNFWDSQTSEQTSTSGDATGRTTEEMKTRATFTGAGWDFTSVWFMIEDVTYPLLTPQDAEAPRADAGPDQTVDEGTLVTFDGSGSRDNSGIVDYIWTFTDGAPVTLHGARPTHLFDNPGTFVMTLNVTDTAGNWDTDTVTVTVRDITAPVAYAGEDLTIDEDSRVTFNGSGCSDNVGIMSYAWSFTDGVRVVLLGVGPSYLFSNPGVFVVTLSIVDAAGNPAIDAMTVTVRDVTPPTADAGPDSSVDVGTLVTFDGSGSGDNVGIVSFTWTFTDGTPVTLNGIRPEHLFDTPGTFVVTLHVTDAAGNGATDTMTVTVGDLTPPTANAGPDQIVDQGRSVVLDGSGSSDNVGVVNFTWTFRYATETIALYSVSPSFTFDAPDKYVISLRVSDAAGQWSEDTVAITVLDVTPPVANAGPDLTLPVRTTVSLSGSLSTDNEGIKSYSWTFLFGTESEMRSGEVVRFTLEHGGVYQAILNVSDLIGNTDEDIALITVVDTGTVIGTVLDERGRPVEGAKVELTASDGTTRSTTTGANGTFVIDILYGPFSWEITKEGYRAISGTSSVSPMDTTVLELPELPLERVKWMGPSTPLLLIMLIVIVTAVVAAALVLRKRG